MYDEIVGKILESLDSTHKIEGASPRLSWENYRACKIDAKNFHAITKKFSGRSIAFIDGGNAEIIGSGSFSLNLVRICSVIYKDNKRIGTKKFEILAFVQAVSQNNEIHFKTTFFKAKNSLEMDEFSFSSFDRALMLGFNRAEISSMPNAIRRFAELKLAKLIAEEKLADIIVLDGNLQGTLTNENEYLDELYAPCGRNDIVLAALSKTTSLFTDNGDLLSAVLGNLSPSGPWFYHPIAEISSASHKAEMFFAKLHESSRHIFRLEIFNEQKAKAEETINSLAGNCIDPIFIGYPYGLVEADKIARVSHNEKESLKTIFLAKLSSKNIEKYLNSANAHEILDRVSF
ncbi:DNA double-strand break repair nuclease NurA [Candidatus Woesearchaeota archaeon]|nr:DNA double-strand break repair nuclease NurA [Candidatus Woesearchaeota archaeon]